MILERSGQTPEFFVAGAHGVLPSHRSWASVFIPCTRVPGCPAFHSVSFAVEGHVLRIIRRLGIRQ